MLDLSRVLAFLTTGRVRVLRALLRLRAGSGGLLVGLSNRISLLLPRRIHRFEVVHRQAGKVRRRPGGEKRRRKRRARLARQSRRRNRRGAA